MKRDTSIEISPHKVCMALAVPSKLSGMCIWLSICFFQILLHRSLTPVTVVGLLLFFIFLYTFTCGFRARLGAENLFI